MDFSGLKKNAVQEQKVGKKKKALTPCFCHFIVKAQCPVVIMRFKGN